MFRCLIASLVVALAANSLYAGVIETGSDRSNYALVGLDNDSDGPHQNFGPVVYGDWMNTTSASAVDGSDNADADASQTSSINPGTYVADLSAIASIDYNGFFGGSTAATSEYIVAFTITSPMTYSIDGQASISGGGSGVMVSLVNVGGGGTPSQSFANISLNNNSVVIDSDGALLPGDYELRARATAGFDFFFETGSGTTDATASLTMNIVPEPASVLLLAVGGVLAIRRRRAA